MKKLFTITIIGLLSTGAFAQTSQGTKVVSGSMRISTDSDNSMHQGYSSQNYSSLYLYFSPSFGYLFKENLEAGLSVGYTYNESESTQDRDLSDDYNSANKSNTYGFSPYLKKYFTISEKVALSTKFSAGLSFGRSNYESTNAYPATSEYKSKGISANFIPGITFFPSEKFGISASFGDLGYHYTTSENENNGYKSTSKDFELDLSSSTFGIGFSYHF
ncbi:hypothetical protein [Pontibacter populi]|uniref:Outer membrane protein beta-barrel domain-containing protein n=1 Tax=Pontibacter populi TaxID=890055 RepID=A0ABV1RTT8_9BACT